MRRNSVWGFVVALAIIMSGMDSVAEAGGLLSRLFVGRNRICRTTRTLGMCKPAQPKNCCPASNACEPMQNGVTQNCPTELLMMVSDVDENGKSQCVYRVFFISDCRGNQSFTTNLICEVDQSVCANGKCGANGSDALNSSFIDVMPLASSSPSSGGTPIANPGTEDVKISLDPIKGILQGIPPVHPKSTRQAVGVKANPVWAGYFQATDSNGNAKYFELYRLTFNRDNEVKQVGIGFPIDALPPGATLIPGRLSNVANKTHRVDETNPEKPNEIVWTYVVHDYK